MQATKCENWRKSRTKCSFWCSHSSLWFSRGLAVSMGEAAKRVLSACFKLCKLEEVSYEMLVFLHPRVLSRVSGFPVASPCLWGKPQNLSFSNVSKQLVISFCVAGVALCETPTRLITCRKCQNWRRCVAVFVAGATLWTCPSSFFVAGAAL